MFLQHFHCQQTIFSYIVLCLDYLRGKKAKNFWQWFLCSYDTDKSLKSGQHIQSKDVFLYIVQGNNNLVQFLHVWNKKIRITISRSCSKPEKIVWSITEGAAFVLQ